MAIFRYEAVDKTGKIVMGAMDASTEADVNTRLAQMGYRPQLVIAPGAGTAVAAPHRTASGNIPVATGQAPAAQSAATLQPMSGPVHKGRAKPRELALFFRQMASMSRAGITLFQGLDTLAPRTQNSALAQSAREMADTTRSGGRISDVMAQYPGLFAPHVVSSVRAGELGGFVDIVLDEIAYDYEQDIAFYKGLWVAKLLVIQGLFALAVGQPLFPTLFPNNQLVHYLQLVFFRNIPIVCVALALYSLVYKRFLEPSNRELRDRLAMRFLPYGDLARQKSIASFVRMLRRLYAAGLGPAAAWEGAMHVPANSVIRAKLAEAYDLVSQRHVPIHEAFESTGLFANEVEQLLATGNMTGEVVETLDRVAEYYQDNVDRAFRNARFWTWRLSITGFIILTGALVILLTKTYFDGIFAFADKFAEP